MNSFIRRTALLLLLFLLVPSFAGCASSGDARPESDTAGESTPQSGPLPTETDPEETSTEPNQGGSDSMTPFSLYWPEDRIFPAFPAPKGPLCAIPVELLSEDEQISLATLQGIVNASGIRLVLLDRDVDLWLDTYGDEYNRVSDVSEKFEALQSFWPEASGIVLYDPSKSEQYVNLACSVANTLRAVPMTRRVYTAWKKKGMSLPILKDLTDMTLTGTEEIYRYLYDEYFFDMQTRFVLIQRPGMYQMRDLAAATGAAVLYLSCEGNGETDLFRSFLMDMTPGRSILAGWYADQERELMTVSAGCGISCVPADHFSNPTVFARQTEITPRAVPACPELENKIYVAFYFSDGDNVQYDMHAMREFWDAGKSQRDRVTVNWTISPALADLAPGMMQYYYDTAPDNVCFVCGPSGMGYTMPVNSFGPNTGEQFTDESAFAAYVRLTDAYLRRTGLRSVTVWDNLTPAQRSIYTKEAPYLYGLTVQHFTNASLGLGYTGVVNGTPIAQMTPAYFSKNAQGTTPLSQIRGDIESAVAFQKYDGTSPAFVSVQVNVWDFHSLSEVERLEQALNRAYGAYGENPVVFVRADHYFNLYNRARGLPYDLTIGNGVCATASSGNESATLALDGSTATLWQADAPGAAALTLSLGRKASLSGVRLYFSPENQGQTFSPQAVTLETSSDGQTWRRISTTKSTPDGVTVCSFPFTEASFLRITLEPEDEHHSAHLKDLDLLGK